MRTIFLSYRRQDSADICDRLSDHLRRRYGSERVFRDVSTILVGSVFPQTLRQALEDCRAMVVVIVASLPVQGEQAQARQVLYMFPLILLNVVILSIFGLFGPRRETAHA